MHIQLLVLFKAGKPLISTVGDPGTQGATVAGIHGMGVSTPNAAAVAEATSGFEGVVHIPKVGIFVIGAKSMIVAAGRPPTSTVGADVATKGAGATPKVHMSIAVETTSSAIALPFLVRCTPTAARGYPPQEPA
jgi:hypothetical protein